MDEGQRLSIYHISSLQFDEFFEILTFFVAYVWQRLNINEIKIQIFTEENSNKCNSQIVYILKDTGFQMKALLNDKFNDKRAFIYSKKRGARDKLTNFQEEVPLKMDLKAMCFMSNKPQHL